RNPWTHIISHPGDGTAELEFEPLVVAARENHTLLEINNASLKPARHKEFARANNLEILRLSMKYDTPVILGSDAHITFDVANYEQIIPLLNEVDFPDELILNYDPKAFFKYLGIPE
ncbi:MAG: phosphatase, partial [Bacteroidales bacterium]|nr:phosphatase [Bacteroidales bacterium]